MCGAAAAWLAIGATLGHEGLARLLLPFYPLALVPFLRLRGARRLAAGRRGRAVALSCALSAVPALILTPSRPLWPAVAAVGRLRERAPQNRLLARAWEVYRVYAERSDSLAAVRRRIPGGCDLVGFVGTDDDSPVSLWRPFGQRRVVNLLYRQLGSGADIAAAGVDVFVARRSVVERFCGPFDAWASRLGAEVLGRARLTVKVSEGADEWCVVRLPAGAVPQESRQKRKGPWL